MKTQIIPILTPFVLAFALGLDIYIPIIPQMTQIFDTTPGMVQLTMSLFLFMVGFGQLFIGPLSDYWGRKKTFYLATSCFSLGSLGCALSSTIEELIFFRLVASLGACGMLVNSFAIVRDLYSSEESAKMFSYLNGAIGISPTFAPILGGFLAVSFNWTAVFYFLVGLGAFALLVAIFFVEETKKQSVQAPFKAYLKIISHRPFLLYAVLAGLAEAIFFCFFSVSPFIIIDLHGIPTDQFGYYFACFGSVIGLAGFAGGKLIGNKGIFFTMRTGILLILTGGVLMLMGHYVAPMSLSMFLIPMVIACSGAMFLLGGAASCALEPFGMMAGTAAAAFGAMEFAIPSLVGSVLMLFPAQSTFPYAISILILGTLSLFLFYMRNQKDMKFLNG